MKMPNTVFKLSKKWVMQQVLYPEFDFESEVYDEWLRLVKEKNIKYTLAQAGQQVNIGDGTVIEVLNPQSPFLVDTDSDIDNNGVVLRLSKDGVSFLLTADTMWQAELEVITRRVKLSSTALKVGHHGSSTSTTPEFLAVVNPQLAVISVGADNTFGHPAPSVMARLEDKVGSENIYRTDKHGTIEFITDGETIWVSLEN